MVCKNCGAKIPDGCVACRVCGERITPQQEVGAAIAPAFQSAGDLEWDATEQPNFHRDCSDNLTLQWESDTSTSAPAFKSAGNLEWDATEQPKLCQICGRELSRGAKICEDCRNRISHRPDLIGGSVEKNAHYKPTKPAAKPKRSVFTRIVAFAAVLALVASTVIYLGKYRQSGEVINTYDYDIEVFSQKYSQSISIENVNWPESGKEGVADVVASVPDLVATYRMAVSDRQYKGENIAALMSKYLSQCSKQVQLEVPASKVSGEWEINTEQLQYAVAARNSLDIDTFLEEALEPIDVSITTSSTLPYDKDYAEDYYDLIYQHYQNHFGVDPCRWDMYYTRDSAFVYAQLEKDVLSRPFAKQLLDIAKVVIQGVDYFALGRNAENATIQYYEIALISLLKTMEENYISAAPSIQSTSDQTMTMVDYMLKATDTVTGLYNIGVGQAKDELVKSFNIIIGADAEGIGLVADTLNLVKTDEELKHLKKAANIYTSFDLVLSAIIDYQDPTNSQSTIYLQQAAKNVRSGLSQNLAHHFQNFGEWVKSANSHVGGFVFTELLNNISSEDIAQLQGLFSQDELINMQVLSGAAQLYSSFTSGVKYGIFICDCLYGSSDTLLRYHEICAMAGVRRALLQKTERVRERIDSREDIDIILNQLAPCLYGLLYVNARGEYCAYDLQMSSAKLLGKIIVNEENCKEWYASVCEITQSEKTHVDHLFVDPESIRQDDIDIPSATLPDNGTSAYDRYIAAGEATVASGSWTENLSMTAFVTISNGALTVKENISLESSLNISGYRENDTSKLQISGSANMKTSGQDSAWTITYSDGIAHYNYTKPTVTSKDVAISPNYFEFGSLTEDMILSSFVSGNTVTLTVDGAKMSGIGLAAVAQMGSVDNLEYGNVTVEAVIDPDSGTINMVTMLFDVSMCVQGYDAEAEYEIIYRFSN